KNYRWEGHSLQAPRVAAAAGKVGRGTAPGVSLSLQILKCTLKRASIQPPWPAHPGRTPVSDDTFLTLNEGAGQDSPQGRLQLLLLLRGDMIARWQRGDRFLVEDYFRKYPLLRSDAEALLELVYLEALLREGQGDSPLV